MLAILACSKCGEVVSTSSRSTVLPFVCDKCQKNSQEENNNGKSN